MVLPSVLKKSNGKVKIMNFTPNNLKVLAYTWNWSFIVFSWTIYDDFELLLDPGRPFEFKGIYSDFNFFVLEVYIEFNQFFWLFMRNCGFLTYFWALNWWKVTEWKLRILLRGLELNLEAFYGTFWPPELRLEEIRFWLWGYSRPF